MNKKFKLSKLMVGVASLTLSAGVFAGSSGGWDSDPWTDWVDGTAQVVSAPFTGWTMDRMNHADYMLEDKMDHSIDYLDGVDPGYPVSSDGNLKYDIDCVRGDKLTNLHTKKSGIIKDIKRQGTMDVMTHDGKTVRYQYVTFTVKPL